MQMVGNRLCAAMWQELFGGVLQDPQCQLAKGGGTTACTGCGKGVKNRFMLCQGCGYDRTRMRIWQRAHRDFFAEVQRLATIEISN